MALFTRKRTRGEVKPVTLLIADDDAHDQMLFTMAAEECEHSPRVEFVYDGEALLRRLRHDAEIGTLPELVILDLRMPKLNGHEVLAELAQDPLLCDLETVVFSTSQRTTDANRSVELGARHHEIKPSTYPELVAFVTDAVSGCLARRVSTHSE